MCKVVNTAPIQPKPLQRWFKGITGLTNKKLWSPLEPFPRVIVGLGDTKKDVRYCVGRQFVDYFAEKLEIEFEDLPDAEAEVAFWAEGDIMLLKSKRPIVESGVSCAKIMDSLDLQVRDMLLVNDCLFTLFGEWSFHRRLPHNGHPGVISCMEYCSSNRFWRVGIGIGEPQHPKMMKKYIKTRFLRHEKEVLYESVFQSLTHHFLQSYLAGTPHSLAQSPAEKQLDAIYQWNAPKFLPDGPRQISR